MPCSTMITNNTCTVKMVKTAVIIFIVACLGQRSFASLTNRECYEMDCYRSIQKVSEATCTENGCNNTSEAFTEIVLNQTDPNYDNCINNKCWEIDLFSETKIPFDCLNDGCFSKKSRDDAKFIPPTAPKINKKIRKLHADSLYVYDDSLLLDRPEGKKGSDRIKVFAPMLAVQKSSEQAEKNEGEDTTVEGEPTTDEGELTTDEGETTTDVGEATTDVGGSTTDVGQLTTVEV